MRARELGAVGTEVRADVAESGGVQHRIDHRVRHGVAVRVPRQRLLARPFEAREPQGSVAAVRVHVGADADARLPRA